MRRCALVTALLGAATVAAVAPAPAAATGYCSPSGDQCYSAKRVEGQVRLATSSAAWSPSAWRAERPAHRQPRGRT